MKRRFFFAWFADSLFDNHKEKSWDYVITLMMIDMSSDFSETTSEYIYRNTLYKNIDRGLVCAKKNRNKLMNKLRLRSS